MLDEKEAPLELMERPIGDDGLPVIEMDQAYHDRIAEQVRGIIGAYPAWYADTPEERIARRGEVLERLRKRQEAEPVPHVPLEYLRREHLYD